MRRASNRCAAFIPASISGRVDLAQLNVVSLETRLWDEEAIEADIQRVLHEPWLADLLYP